jgi:hypothetical protein
MKDEAFSTPKSRPSEDYPRSPIPPGIQDEIRLENRLRRQWQVNRETALRVGINHLQRSVTRLLKDRRYDLWTATNESLDHDYKSHCMMTKWVVRISVPSPPGHPGGNAVAE